MRGGPFLCPSSPVSTVQPLKPGSRSPTDSSAFSSVLPSEAMPSSRTNPQADFFENTEHLCSPGPLLPSQRCCFLRQGSEGHNHTNLCSPDASEALEVPSHGATLCKMQLLPVL